MSAQFGLAGWPRRAEEPAAELLAQITRLVGGSDTILIIDDTALPKKGALSVAGSAICQRAGQEHQWQILVSLTLARDEVPIPIVLRLFLRETWVQDPECLQHAGLPEALWTERSKLEVALAELGGIAAGHASRGLGWSWPMLAMASAPLPPGALGARTTLDVGTVRIQKADPADVTIIAPQPSRGWSRTCLIPD